MKIIADLHTHTIVSQHAFSTVDEIINAAKDKGFLAVAITDHGPKSSDGAKPVHFRSMHNIPEYVNGIMVLRGAEANIIDYDGNIDLRKNVLECLDFVIASYHEDSITPSNIESHTNGYIGLIKNSYVDCLGHVGNPKFAFDMEKIIKLCKDYNKLIEINSASFKVRKGSDTNCKEAALLCKKYNLNIVVTSDSHSKYNVGNHEAALNMLEDINFPEDLILNADFDRLMNYLNSRNRN